MPELPEVETVRRSVEAHLLGRVVRLARLLRRDVLVAPGDPAGGFSRQRGTRRSATPVSITPADLLEGATIARVQRLGKQIAIIGVDRSGAERALGVQLGMTGHLEVGRGEPATTHVHAVWTLDVGVLAFSDPRRFGSLRVFRTMSELEEHLRPLGPDALSIDPEALAQRLAGARRPIKAALLDQSVLAGVGNIYADEALFLSGIHPEARADRLSGDRISTLAASIRRVMSDALLAGGSTIRDYRSGTGEPGTYQAAHRVYGKAGHPCPACGELLRGSRVAQRATVYCSRCQPRRRKRPTLL